ncbi:MAG: hypothetical protein IRZ33_00475 [Alicyclobacillaceae bacterium]|nr:hypothetical protein [Alicyclobacillaceae bacterium]
MTILRSEEWSNAHLLVNDLLSKLLNALRDLGYNPSLHIRYAHDEHRLLVDDEVLHAHPELRHLYEQYRRACDQRDEALRKIQSLPKIDLGFEAQVSHAGGSQQG